MQSLANRIAHYNARMQSSLLDPTVTAVNSVAQANFATETALLYANQQALINILNSNGIVTILWGAYFGLLGEMHKAAKTSSGGVLVLRFTELVAKWEARGVGHGAAVQMAADIFSVTIV